MATDPSLATGWTRYSAAYPIAVERSVDQVELGPGLPALDRRFIGDVVGSRVLDLGCGMGHGAVALARQGAKVIAVDPDASQLAHARQLAEQHAVKVELHHADLAELAFIRSASIDLVLSVFALAAVDDLDRVFRQVHRILHPGAPFLLTLPHPFTTLLREAGDGSLRVERPFSSRAPLGEGPTLTYPHQFSDIHTSLTRANFRVDAVLEPETDSRSPWRNAMTGWVPSTLVMRARKEGI
ncbi:MAG TPA: class I SAM-dependent methyltransferase [Acidimicrobiales bacterium]